MNEDWDYVVFHVDGGIGKNIAATAVARSIKAFYTNSKLIVITAWPEVWVHNPDLYRVYKFGAVPYFYDDFIKDKKVKILRLEPYHTEDLILKKKHLIELWCDLYNIPCLTTQPMIYIGQREFISVNAKIQKRGPILVVQTSGGAENQGYAYSWARDLPPSTAQSIVNSVKGSFDKILHIRRDNQPALEHTESISGGLRDLFCYILLGDKFLGIDSFMQHACAAFNKPAAVGWIANSPNVFGYSLHTNILPSGNKDFKHNIDAYLEEADWVGGRFHECPFTNIDSIFDVDTFVRVLTNKAPLVTL